MRSILAKSLTLIIILALMAPLVSANTTLFTDDFETDLSKWTSYTNPTTSHINRVAGKGISGSYAVEVYQTSDAGDTVLYTSMTTPIPPKSIIQIWFYDDTTVTGKQVVDVLENTKSLVYDGKALMVGIDTDTSTTKYVYRIYNSGGFIATTVTRSTGWHVIRFEAVTGNSIKAYIDNTLIATVTSFTTYKYFEIGSYWTVSKAGLYYDNVLIESIPENPIPETPFGALGTFIALLVPTALITANRKK
jgi:hypothetical protein